MVETGRRTEVTPKLTCLLTLRNSVEASSFMILNCLLLL